ncbi:TonB-dependent receptor [Frateuria aurantia]
MSVALGLLSPMGFSQSVSPGAVDIGQGSARGGPATAQASAPSKPQHQATDLGAVVVTANKRSERLQDVPSAVSVIDNTRLERQNATSFADYASQVPGLNMISSGTGWTQLVIRGITSGSHQANATVGTYIDDTPFGSSTIYSAGSMLTPDIDPSDLQRVEVLNGPQGTLYGSNTLGGLVKFVTTPPDTTRASARVSVDSASVKGGGTGAGERAMANIPLIANQLAIRVNVYHRRDPGYITNITTGKKDINQADVSGARAQLLWTPSDKISLRFSALAQNLSSDGLANNGIDVDPSNLKPTYGLWNQARAAGTGMFKVKYRLSDLSGSFDLGWAKLISTTSFSTLRFNENVDLTDSYGPVLNPALGIENGGYSELQHIALNKTTQEFRLESPTDQTLEWRAGVFWTREHTVDDEDILGFNALTGAAVPTPTLGNVVVGPALFTEWAGYGDVTWHASDRFSVLVGARYSSDHTTYAESTVGLLTGTLNITGHSNDQPVTYLFNPSFKFSEDLMAYVRVASGFRPGGPNVGVPAGLGAPLTFDPDRLVNYEIGLKSILLDHKMSLDIDAFYIDWSKVQLTTTADGFSFLGNGGKAFSKGGEINWHYRPVRGLTLNANATYTDAALAQDTGSGTIYGHKGDPLPYVPKWNANVGADYDFPLGMGGWSGFVGGNFSYVGAREADFNSIAGPRVHLPSYNDIDLHIGANYENWTFEFYAKNLADRHGITSTWQETLSAMVTPYNAIYQTPRTVGFSASVDF